MPWYTEQTYPCCLLVFSTPVALHESLRTLWSPTHLGGMQQKCSPDPSERLKALTLLSQELESVPDMKRNKLQLIAQNCQQSTGRCRTQTGNATNSRSTKPCCSLWCLNRLPLTQISSPFTHKLAMPLFLLYASFYFFSKSLSHHSPYLQICTSE